jgi:hypothetical protein
MKWVALLLWLAVMAFLDITTAAPGADPKADPGFNFMKLHFGRIIILVYQWIKFHTKIVKIRNSNGHIF